MKDAKGTGSSGNITSSKSVLTTHGWFVGAYLTAGTAEGTAAKVTIQDSATSSVSGKNELAIIDTNNRKVETPCTCREGIYVTIAGDAECIVYYSK